MNILIYNQISIISKLSSISQSAIADSSLYQREPFCKLLFVLNLAVIKYNLQIDIVEVVIARLCKPQNFKKAT